MLNKRKFSILTSVIVAIGLLTKTLAFASGITGPADVDLIFSDADNKKTGHVWYAEPGQYITASTRDNSSDTREQFVKYGTLTWNMQNQFNPYGTAMFWKQKLDDNKYVRWDQFDINSSRNNGKIKTFKNDYPNNPIDAQNDDIFNQYKLNDKIYIEPQWEQMNLEQAVEFTVDNDTMCAMPGETVAFTYLVANNTPFDLTNPRIELKSSDGTVNDTILKGQAVPSFKTYKNTNRSITNDRLKVVEFNYTVPNGFKGSTINFNAMLFPMFTDIGNDYNISIPCKINIGQPNLTINKTVSNENPMPEEKITYSFTVKNTGNTVLNNVTVSDPKLSELGINILDPSSVSLAAGEEHIFKTTEYTVKANDKVTNTAKAMATAISPCGTSIEVISKDASVATFTAKTLNSSLSLEKTVSNENPREKDKITFSFKVKNTGDTDIDLKNIRIDDPMLKDLGITVSTITSGKLNKGSEYVFTTTEYTVKKEDAGKTFKNTAYAIDMVNNVKSNESTATFTVKAEDKTVSMYLEKTVNIIDPSPGDKIIYTFKVKNTGNDDINPNNITIVDKALDDLGISIIYPNLNKLSPGEVYTLTSSEYIVKSEDAGKTFKNTAYAIDMVSKVKSNESTATFSAKTPGLSVIKTVDKDEALVGDTLTYTIKVQNNGQTDLKNITIKDDLVSNSLTPAGKFDLKSGESKTLTATYVVKQGDKVVNNVALATGKDSNGNDVNSNSSSAVTNIKNQGLKIVKSVKETAIAMETIKYTFVVTNTGDTTIKDVTINDDKIDETTLNPRSVNSLAKGAQAIFTANYTIPDSAKVSDKIKNTATAIGKGLNNTTVVSDPSTAECTIVEPAEPAISVSKTINNANPKTGDTVIYTIIVKNIGNTDLLNINVLDDPLSYNSTINKLSKGESKVINLSKKVTETSGSFTNKVVAEVLNGPSAEATATYNVVIESLYLVKTVNNKTPVMGESVTYTFVVKNTGNQDMKNVTINDPLIDKSTLYPQFVEDLLKGESATFTAKYTIPNNKKVSDKIINKATAIGYTANKDVIKSNESTAVCTISQPFKSGISVSKVVNKTNPKTGDIVKYTIKVINSGNTVLKNIKVVDEALGYNKIIDKLDINESKVIELTKKVTEKSGSFTNEVKAIVANGPEDKAYATYSIFNQSLSLIKTVNNSTPIVDETITYKFKVTNTGNAAIKNITIKDPMIDKSTLNPQSIISLKPGESATFEATYTVLDNMKKGEKITNIASATGKGENNETITSNQSSVIITITETPTKPGFSILKTVDNLKPKKGDTVIYTILVKNTGNSPISNIKITDDALKYTKTISSLDVGKYAKMQITKKVTEDGGKTFTNTAKVKADGYNEICSSVSYIVVKSSSTDAYLPVTGENK